MAYDDNVNATNTLNQLAGTIDNLSVNANANTALSFAEAQRNRDWQAAQNAAVNDFNRQEAAKNRAWQERMSSTAHYREVQDLKSAGLNPILSALGGNGAAVTSGAAASGVNSSGGQGQVDTSLNTALANVFGSLLSTEMNMRNTDVNARLNETIADKQRELNRFLGILSAATDRDVANIYSSATRYAADRSLEGTRYSSDKSYEAQVYHSDKSFDATKLSSENSLAGSLANAIVSMYGDELNYDARMAELNEQILKNQSDMGPFGTAFLRNIAALWGEKSDTHSHNTARRPFIRSPYATTR